MTTTAEGVQRRTLRVLVGAQILAGAGLAAGITVARCWRRTCWGRRAGPGCPRALSPPARPGAASSDGPQDAAGGSGCPLATRSARSGAWVWSSPRCCDSLAPAAQPARLRSGDRDEPAGALRGHRPRRAGERGRAISRVLFATTLGGVAGPNLVGPMGGLAAWPGHPGAGRAVPSVRGRVRRWPRCPRPAAARPVAAGAPARPGGARGAVRHPRPRRAAATACILAVTVMVLTQIVMVAVMTMTPIHMRDHGHGLEPIGLVIAIHVAGMFLASPADRPPGRPVRAHPLAVAAGVALLAAGLSPPDAAARWRCWPWRWHCSDSAGTSADLRHRAWSPTPPRPDRARTQGQVDLLIALAGAGGGLSSGAYRRDDSANAALALAGGFLALAIVPAIAAGARSRGPLAPA